ncbi:MAG TPA: YHYH protein [Candidatus Binatia bacterium]|jgi:hypothetical protein
MTSTTLVLQVVVTAILSIASLAAASPTPAEKCVASKAKAAGAAVSARSKCEQKAISGATTTSQDCVDGADAKLSSAYTKADNAGGCTTTGDEGSTQTAVDACISNFDSAISGDAKCAAAKMKAVGKKAYAKAKCWQKGLTSGSNADSGCLATAETKFHDAVTSADAAGTCTDTEANLEALVDSCIPTIIPDAAPPTCTLDDNTTLTADVNPAGCAVRDRDTSACQSARQSQGLDGYWLKFSCRVSLTLSAGVVTAHTDGQPDYVSNYFATSDPCHETYTGAIQNPNLIAAQSFTVGFPVTPSGSATSMQMHAVVGLALNGVPIFGNFAAPGDDIFQEAQTFDRCGAHPQMSGIYHYHCEPYAISYDDSNFIGVMRDGYPVYGRRDPDNSLPTLDAQGGHTGVTVDSPSTPVYHYHVNEQVDPANSSDHQWFLTTGTWHASPGTCTGGC